MCSGSIGSPVPPRVPAPDWFATVRTSSACAAADSKPPRSTRTSSAGTTAVTRRVLPFGQIENQEQSGNCWLFAPVVLVRAAALQNRPRHRQRESFSETYLYFFDLLEKRARRCCAFIGSPPARNRSPRRPLRQGLKQEVMGLDRRRRVGVGVQPDREIRARTVTPDARDRQFERHRCTPASTCTSVWRGPRGRSRAGRRNTPSFASKRCATWSISSSPIWALRRPTCGSAGARCRRPNTPSRSSASAPANGGS